MLKNRAVFLDRDGVINRLYLRDQTPIPPADESEFEFLPGVLEALKRLRDAGFLIIVVTNQPDIARGTLTLDALRKIHDKMSGQFRFDGIYVCLHDDRDQCDCRKPKPGLILQAAREHHIDLNRSFMVGDRAKDILAGRSAGCATVFIRHPYSGEAEADHTVSGLPEAARIILEKAGENP